MNARILRAVLAHAAAAAGPTADTDADLLARFTKTRDEAAFAELVRRHGRLVWAVCRSLTPSEADADDAFQATFLALMQSAGKINSRGTVAPWLHAVAHRVTGRAKRTAARRRAREQKAAAGEADRGVPPSAWDSTLAAVHEEVARLPETLRVPFVLCVLDGVGVSEAADRLGWKLGTLSGRLTRAKQALLDRLAQRGVPAAAVGAVVVGPVGVCPAGALAKAMTLPGGAASAAVRSLAEGVTGMAITRFKLLAAGLVLAGGMAAGLGGGWTVAADPPAGGNPRAREAEAKEALRLAEVLAAQAAAADREAHVLGLRRLAEAVAREVNVADPPGRYEYDFLTFPQTKAGKSTFPDPDGYRKLFREKEAQGWEYVGTTPARVNTGTKGGGVTTADEMVMVFRRPVATAAKGDRVLLWTEQAAKAQADEAAKREQEAARYLHKLTDARNAQVQAATADAAVAKVRAAVVDALRKNPGARFAPALEAELNANPALKPAVEQYGRTTLEAAVMTELAAGYRKDAEAAREKAEAVARHLNGVLLPAVKEKYAWVSVVVRWNPDLDAVEFGGLVKTAAAKRFPKLPADGLKLEFQKDALTITGPDATVVEWAAGLAKALAGEK